MLYGEGPAPEQPHPAGQARPRRQDFEEPSIDGQPIVKPPYGRITAYDMNKGEKI